MSDSGTGYTDLGYSADTPQLVYDSGSTGGTAGDTGAPTSSFSMTALSDFLSAGAHDLQSWVLGLGHSATPTAQSYANAPTTPHFVPPPSSSGIEPVTVTPAQTLPPTPTPQWLADLTDFTKPAPYVAFVAVLLLLRASRGR